MPSIEVMYEEYKIDVEHLVTEDDAPISLFAGKQQLLLTETLYSSWEGPGDGRKFFAAANIGVFYMVKAAPLVPDVLLSLDVEAHEDIWAKEHRSYFLWEFGKAPDVVIEIVSNKVGGELTTKLERYARMRVPYYVVFDPAHHITEQSLTIFSLNGYSYREYLSLNLPEVSLRLKIWEGEYNGSVSTWLRWEDEKGNLIPTGKERADSEQDRADKLALLLRQLGHDPDKI
jgi:Putative restriction endonuclease